MDPAGRSGRRDARLLSHASSGAGDHISGKRFHSPLSATAQRPSWRDIFHFCLWLIKLPWRYATGRGVPLWEVNGFRIGACRARLMDLHRITDRLQCRLQIWLIAAKNVIKKARFPQMYTVSTILLKVWP